MVMHTWDYGNGNGSIEPHPTAIYGQPGTYELSLTAEVVQLQMTSFHWRGDQDIDDVFGDPDLYFVLSWTVLHNVENSVVGESVVS